MQDTAQQLMMLTAQTLKRQQDALSNNFGNQQSLISMMQPFHEMAMNAELDNRNLTNPDANMVGLFQPSSVFSTAEQNLLKALSDESFCRDDDEGYGHQPMRKKAKVGNSMDRFRPYQAEKWIKHFEVLRQFRKKYGHCLVPHDFPENPALAGWVKRQRHQYKLFQKSRQSFMTRERIKLLEDIGFVWDSHEATWHERLSELLHFKREHGNCLVPSNYLPNLKLATWVKSQRRQYKLYQRGVTSNMSTQRIKILEQHGFEWEVRSESRRKMIEPEEILSFPSDRKKRKLEQEQSDDASSASATVNSSDESSIKIKSEESEDDNNSASDSDENNNDDEDDNVFEIGSNDGDFMDTLFDFLEDDSDFQPDDCD